MLKQPKQRPIERFRFAACLQLETKRPFIASCLSSHYPTTKINLASPRNTTLLCRKLDTVPRSVLHSVYISISLAFLQVISDAVYVQEGVYTLRAANADAKLLASQISSKKECHEATGSIGCTMCSNNNFKEVYIAYRLLTFVLEYREQIDKPRCFFERYSYLLLLRPIPPLQKFHASLSALLAYKSGRGIELIQCCNRLQR